MKPFLLTALSYLIAFGSSFLLLSLLIHPARRYHLVDVAKTRTQATHDGVIPLIGGICIFCALTISLLTMQTFTIWDQLPIFLLCAFITVLVGALDDMRDISAGFRLLIQVLIGLLMFAVADNKISMFGDIVSIGTISFSDKWALPITILAVISAQNAMNMMDGIDGLSAGIALVTLSALGYVGFMSGKPVHVLLLLSVCLIPFILVNLGWIGVQKRVFLGDAGSTLLGFIIAWFLIAFSQGGNPGMRPVTALWLFALPLMDMALISLRRILKGRSPFIADRQHLHHLFSRSGFSKVKTLMIMLCIHIAFVVIGLISELYAVSEVVMFFSFLMLFGLYVYLFRHAWRVARFIRKVF